MSLHALPIPNELQLIPAEVFFSFRMGLEPTKYSDKVDLEGHLAKKTRQNCVGAQSGFERFFVDRFPQYNIAAGAGIKVYNET